MHEKFDDLLVAVDALTLESKDKMKAGIRHSIFYTIGRSAKKSPQLFIFEE